MPYRHLIVVQIFSDHFPQDILDHKYRIIFTNPKMALYHPTFHALIRRRSYMKDCYAIVIDEAHRFSPWGADYCENYGVYLKQLRSLVALDVPFLATSATLPPSVRTDIKARLEYTVSRTYEVNLGTTRRNLTLSAIHMKYSGDLTALAPAVQEAIDGKELKKTMIFCNTLERTHSAAKHLRSLVPEEYQDQIDFLLPARSWQAIRYVIKRFEAGKIKILCATQTVDMVRALNAP